MVEGTGYQAVATQIMKNIIEHGWGEMTFKVTSMKDQKVHIIIQSGLSHHFVIEKEILFDKNIF